MPTLLYSKKNYFQQMNMKHSKIYRILMFISYGLYIYNFRKIKTYFFVDHGMFYMTTAKHGIVQPEKWVVSGNAYPGEPVGTTIDNVNISQDNAVDTIERTLESLGISNFSITEIDKARSLHNFTYETLSTGWRIILCRNDGNSIPFDLRSTNSVGF